MARVVQGQVGALSLLTSVVRRRLKGERDVGDCAGSADFAQEARQYANPGLWPATGHFAVAGSIQAAIFDFAAVTAAYRRPTWRKNDVSPEDLAQVNHDLYDLGLRVHAK